MCPGLRRHIEGVNLAISSRSLCAAKIAVEKSKVISDDERAEIIYDLAAKYLPDNPRAVIFRLLATCAEQSQMNHVAK